MNSFRISVCCLLFTITMSAVAQTITHNPVALGNYVYTAKTADNLFVSKILFPTEIFKVELTGPTAKYFRIADNSLYLTSAGAKQIKSKKQIALTLAVAQPSGLQKVTYTILYNNFSKDKVVAHRGAWKKLGLPTNSIAALKQAFKLGFQGSEFDVHLTADEVLVINHDPDFEGLRIEKSTYQQLLEKTLPNGEHIPTLDAFIKAGMAQRGTKLYLEIKPSVISKERGIIVADKVMQMVQSMQAQGWINYISFDYAICKRILQIEPGADVAYLDGLYAPDLLKKDGINADYHYNVYNTHKDWIENAHKLGVSINAWTVNDAEIMRTLLANGADLITTNEPELLTEVLKEKGKQ